MVTELCLLQMLANMAIMFFSETTAKYISSIR